MLNHIADVISDEIAVADFPNAAQWCEPLKKMRNELLEEADYLLNLEGEIDG